MPLASGSVLAQALFPVAVFVAAGFALRRVKGTDLRPLAQVALYAFSPALVFSSLVTSRLTARDIVGIVAFAGIMLAVAVPASRLTGRLLRLRPEDQVGLDLALMFPNSANLGLPLVTFALGDLSFHAAVLFVLTQIAAINTVGAYVAARSRLAPRRALGRVAKLPPLWALLAALVVRLGSLPVPTLLLRAAQLGAQAYVPAVLVVLGSSLADWPAGAVRDRLAWLATALRLVLMPAVAAGAAVLLGVTPATAHALVLQSATPVAVNALILAQEFDAAPGLVSRTISLSTLGALATLPLWLARLGTLP